MRAQKNRDRVTNTIRTADGTLAMRPTVCAPLPGRVCLLERGQSLPPLMSQTVTSKVSTA